MKELNSWTLNRRLRRLERLGLPILGRTLKQAALQFIFSPRSVSEVTYPHENVWPDWTRSGPDSGHKAVFMERTEWDNYFTAQTHAVLKRTGLDNIRVHYINGCSSSKIFTPPKEKQCCPDPWDSCGSSTRTNQCHTKNCVYKIKCSHWDAVYSGKTSRNIGSKIKEHIRMVKQTVSSIIINHPCKISLGKSLVGGAGGLL